MQKPAQSLNQQPPFCTLVKFVFLSSYRVELWVYNTNTTEDWTNKVDVLGKFTELWIATMLWRHGVIKFDNCAELRKGWQATPCFGEEKHKIELVKRFWKFWQWIKAISLDMYLIVTLNVLALLIFLVKRFSISFQVSSCNILATCLITSICYCTVPATRAPPLKSLRLLPTSWLQYCNLFITFRRSYQFLWAGLYDSLYSRNRKHAPCLSIDLLAFYHEFRSLIGYATLRE